MKASALEQLRRSEAQAADDWHPLDGVPAPDYVPERWTGEHVMLRLIKAFEILNLVMSAPGPRSPSGLWPGIRRERKEVEDVEYAIESAALRGEVDRRPTLVRAKSDITARMIHEMEHALYWPAQFVVDRNERRALLTWAMAKAAKRDMTRICRKRGWAYSTTRRRRDAAGKTIADALNRAGRPVF
ncbi:hypothetical protein [Terrarubrum flagellatum]|uniref:hypothetical protein n=1 Tax=Terrirubrum flagellatum TaxID=2895980 RepID=UPI0031451924